MTCKLHHTARSGADTSSSTDFYETVQDYWHRLNIVEIDKTSHSVYQVTLCRSVLISS